MLALLGRILVGPQCAEVETTMRPLSFSFARFIVCLEIYVGRLRHSIKQSHKHVGVAQASRRSCTQHSRSSFLRSRHLRAECMCVCVQCV